MQYRITAPSKFNSEITLPASKSISNRALIIHAISGNSILPQNLSDCDDTEVIIDALSTMPGTIDVKAAGTAMRFMTAYLAIKANDEHIITGSQRMQQRPIKVLVEALQYLGADIQYDKQDGFPPIHIHGKALKGGHIDIPGDVSSQYISALLMIGTVLTDGLEMRLTGEIISRPYIDLTLWVMQEFGASVSWTDVDTITVHPSSYRERDFLIENDWSAASYWYEMMALNGDNDSQIRLNGLTDGSQQGDSIVKYLFNILGVKTSFDVKRSPTPTTVTLKHGLCTLSRLDYDFKYAPDLAQTFVVCCALKGIPFHFTGLASLRIKETDRIEALKTELRKLGIVIQDQNDSELIWDGEHCNPTFEPIETYEDHRMAMAFAPAAIMFDGLIINDPQVVSKSYTHFWDDLRTAGFTIEEV